MPAQEDGIWSRKVPDGHVVAHGGSNVGFVDCCGSAADDGSYPDLNSGLCAESSGAGVFVCDDCGDSGGLRVGPKQSLAKGEEVSDDNELFEAMMHSRWRLPA